jgi:hypothetical protein
VSIITVFSGFGPWSGVKMTGTLMRYLSGVDEPERIISLQQLDGTWTVEGAETAAPDYVRPGFTELISSDFHIQPMILKTPQTRYWNLFVGFPEDWLLLTYVLR